MERVLLLLLILMGVAAFAGVFLSFDSFLGFGVAQKLSFEGEQKQVDFLTNYGFQLGLDYGLHRGLRLGTVLSSQSFSVRFQDGNFDLNLLCFGIQGSFAMDFLDLVLQISGEVQWPFASYGPGMFSWASHQGNLWVGKAALEKFLSENLSVAVGGGVKYLSLKDDRTSMSLTSFVPFVLLRIGYSF